MADLSRRSLLALAAVGAVGTAVSWKRLTAPTYRAAAPTPSTSRSSAPRRTPPPGRVWWTRSTGAPRHPGAGAGDPGRRLEQLLRQDPDAGRRRHAARRLLRRHRGRAALRRPARRARSTSSSGATPPRWASTSPTCTRRCSRRSCTRAASSSCRSTSTPPTSTTTRRRWNGPGCHGRPTTGPRTTSSRCCGRWRAARAGDFRPYFWTNRLWGGVVPWLYVNDTSFLVESKAPGGDWLWDQFYPGRRSGARRRLPVARAQRRGPAGRGVVRVPPRASSPKGSAPARPRAAAASSSPGSPRA